MIPAALLRQIKNDTLTSLNVYVDIIQKSGQQLEEKDMKVLNDYFKTSKNLRELDVASTMVFDYVTEGLKENKSLTKLVVRLGPRNYMNLVNLLAVHPALSDLNVDASRIEGDGVTAVSKAMGARAQLTRVSVENVNYVADSRNYDASPFIAALTKSANLIYFHPKTSRGYDVLEKACAANLKAADGFISKYLSKAPLDLSDMATLKVRFPSILSVAEAKLVDKNAVARMMVDLEDIASSFNTPFSIPSFYESLASMLARGFSPSAQKVDFAGRNAESALTPAEAFNAVAAGQTIELLDYLKKQGGKLTAEACLFKPEGERENMIELVARQGALAAFMTVANWKGNGRAFKAVAAAVPAREWKRQMGDVTPEILLSRINAGAFKKPRPGQ